MSVHETPRRVTSTVDLKPRLDGGLPGVDLKSRLDGGLPGVDLKSRLDGALPGVDLKSRLDGALPGVEVHLNLAEGHSLPAGLPPCSSSDEIVG